MRAEREIRAKYRALLPAMDERHRRVWAGAEARALGRGGICLLLGCDARGRGGSGRRGWRPD
jgi:hypothetical protein